MSDFDEIRERLNKLKNFNNSMKEQINDEQLNRRLIRLKGLDVNDGASNQKPNYFLSATKFKTEAEETDYLFSQLCDQVKIDDRIKSDSGSLNDERTLFASLSTNKDDSKDNPDFDCNFNENFVRKSYRKNKNNQILTQIELEKELGYLKKNMNDFYCKLKDFSKKNSASSNQSNTQIKNLNNQFDQLTTESSTDEESEEKFVGIVKKFVDEVNLEKLTGPTNQNKNDEEDNFKMDKFDFCYICNEDAIIECKDCDDRFCLNCFKEFHQDLEYRKHSLY